MTRPPEEAVLHAAAALGRALREEGLVGGVDADAVFCRALAELDVRRLDHVYWGARASFVRRPEEAPAFHRVFARFWTGRPLEEAAAVAEHGEGDPRMPAPQHGGESLPQYRQEGRVTTLVDGGHARASSPLDQAAAPDDRPLAGRRKGVLAAYSPEEVLGEEDRLGFAAADARAVRRLAADLRSALPERRSRRLRAGRSGRLDVRATVRASLRTDGELVRPARHGPSLRPRRLVVLCDVSGSMERYSRALLSVLGAAVTTRSKAEAFAFATRLTRLTGTLGSRSGAEALEAARAAVADWSGGTRIGEALADFNRTYGRRGLARGAIVVVVSDGWDRGDQDLLAAELERLRLQCRRLVWLNPRPASLDHQPLAVGMRTALPLVDDVVAGSDPRDAATLVRLLAGLDPRRPAR